MDVIRNFLLGRDEETGDEHPLMLRVLFERFIRGKDRGFVQVQM